MAWWTLANYNHYYPNMVDDNFDELVTGSKTLTALHVVGDATITGDLVVDATTFYVDSTNDRVGIGTTSPSVDFQIEGAPAQVDYIGYGGDPELSLKCANGTQGTPTILTDGDRYGVVFFRGYDGAAYDNGAAIIGQVDGTVTANSMPGTLLLQTTAISSTTLVTRIQVGQDGAVYMPAVYGDDLNGMTYRDLLIKDDGQLGYDSSTLRHKTNITDMESIDSWFYDLRPVNFEFKVKTSDGVYSEESHGVKKYGLIAEEVEVLNDKFVFYNKIINDEEITYQVEGVQYREFIPVLIKAIQDQKTRIDELEERLATLEDV